MLPTQLSLKQPATVPHSQVNSSMIIAGAPPALQQGSGPCHQHPPCCKPACQSVATLPCRVTHSSLRLRVCLLRRSSSSGSIGSSSSRLHRNASGLRLGCGLLLGQGDGQHTLAQAGTDVVLPHAVGQHKGAGEGHRGALTAHELQQARRGGTQAQRQQQQDEEDGSVSVRQQWRCRGASAGTGRRLLEASRGAQQQGAAVDQAGASTAVACNILLGDVHALLCQPSSPCRPAPASCRCPCGQRL